MMNRARMIDLLDKALEARVSKIFDQFATNEVIDDPAAQRKFERALSITEDAHARALGIIEKIFPA